MASGPLPASVIRGLGDRSSEKRLESAREITRIIKEILAKNASANVEMGECAGRQEIEEVIGILVAKFVRDKSVANKRKGGLVGLAATAIGLNKEVVHFLPQLINPVLEHFRDPDTRVRCTACETMYNVAKVARKHTLQHFNPIFQGLADLAGDQDGDVLNNQRLVHSLMKDHVTAYGEEFDVVSFIPVLKDLLRTQNPPVRQFLIEWIKVLHDVPDIDILAHLPDFIDGIFLMVTDRTDEIHTLAVDALKEFEEDLKLAGDNEYAASEFEQLIPHLKHFCHDDVIFRRATALKWVSDFIVLCSEFIIPNVADILDSFLPSYSHQDTKRVADWAHHIQGHLEGIIKMTEHQVDYQNIFKVLVKHIDTQPAKTQCAAMRWMQVLFLKDQDEVLNHLGLFFDSLVKKLGAEEEEVANAALLLLIMLAGRPDQFSTVLKAIMGAFENEHRILRTRGHRFICQLGTKLGAEQVFREMARVMMEEESNTLERIDHLSTMVQTLNDLLLTATEFQDLQNKLQQGLGHAPSRELFMALYPSWCHNVIATVSLCLLASAHKHANTILSRFGSIQMTTAILMQIDRLVLLLESPSYTFLRLQLLEPLKHPELIKSLFGILMLLPQSDAYHKLKSRLDCINTLALLPQGPAREDMATLAHLDFHSMSEHFDAVQLRRRHAKEALDAKRAQAQNHYMPSR